MKYPYYNPNLRFLDLWRALFLSKTDAEDRIIGYFEELTGKKHILITNSCRSALYLAYKSIGKKGEVITSPLTCKVAIDPIVELGNSPVFADVSTKDLNIEINDIEHRVNSKTIAIQAIHFGGVSCNLNSIYELAKKNNLLIIEDCAQSLGAKYKNGYTGSYGDIACFSLIKNVYGIGGGILATDSIEFFSKAKDLLSNAKTTPKRLAYYRVLRNILESKSNNFFFKLAIKLIYSLKGGVKSYKTVTNQIFNISAIEVKIASIQINRLGKLHNMRVGIGKSYYDSLVRHSLLHNNGYDPVLSSFTKFYLYNNKINSKTLTASLAKQGIEAMHLEHKHGGGYQEPLISKETAIDNGLHNYLRVHDSLISLPLTERMLEEDVLYITKKLKTIIDG